MNIEQGRIQVLMFHKIFNGQQICPIFIKVGSEGMPERTACDPVLPAERFFMGAHMPHDVKVINRPGRIGLFWKKPAAETSVFKLILCENIQSMLGKDGVAVETAFGMGGMDPHIFALDITVTEITDFTDLESGREEIKYLLLFEFGQREDKNRTSSKGAEWDPRVCAAHT